MNNKKRGVRIRRTHKAKSTDNSVIIIKMSDSSITSCVGSSFSPLSKHPAWKGERTGLFIRVPVEVAKELRDEAQQTQQHFNDVAIKRLRTNNK
jgi:hypothetical protein